MTEQELATVLGEYGGRYLRSYDPELVARVLWLRYWQGKKLSRREVGERLGLGPAKVILIDIAGHMALAFHAPRWFRDRLPAGHPFLQEFTDGGMRWRGKETCPHCDGTGVIDTQT